MRPRRCVAPGVGLRFVAHRHADDRAHAGQDARGIGAAARLRAVASQDISPWRPAASQASKRSASACAAGRAAAHADRIEAQLQRAGPDAVGDAHLSAASCCPAGGRAWRRRTRSRRRDGVSARARRALSRLRSGRTTPTVAGGMAPRSVDRAGPLGGLLAGAAHGPGRRVRGGRARRVRGPARSRPRPSAPGGPGSTASPPRPRARGRGPRSSRAGAVRRAARSTPNAGPALKTTPPCSRRLSTARRASRAASPICSVVRVRVGTSVAGERAVVT